MKAIRGIIFCLLTASFIKLADGTVQRLGQDVEGIFGTKIWR